MKTIAALTMIFLPASAVSSFFGMVFFDNTDQGVGLSVSPDWWLFPVVTLPLTMAVIGAWKWWSETAQLYRSALSSTSETFAMLWHVLVPASRARNGQMLRHKCKEADEESGGKSSIGT